MHCGFPPLSHVAEGFRGQDIGKVAYVTFLDQPMAMPATWD